MRSISSLQLGARPVHSWLQAFIDQVVKQDDFDIVLTGAGTSEFVGNSLFQALNPKYDFKVKSYASTDLVPSPENFLSRTKPTLLVNFGPRVSGQCGGR